MRAVLCACFVCAGCGLELAGSLGAPDGSGPTNNDGALVDGSANDGTTTLGDGSDIPAPIEDGGADADAKPPTVTPSISMAAQSNPPDVDLTAEGTIDWAHWGTIANGQPVRKMNGGSKISHFTLANSSCDDNYGPSWPVSAKWGDGTPTMTQAYTDLHRRIYGTNGTTVTLTAPCDNNERKLFIDFGGWSATSRLDVTFDNIPSNNNSSTNGNNNGYYATRYTITYVCPIGTRVVAKFTGTTLPTSNICAGSDLILSSAWLR